MLYRQSFEILLFKNALLSFRCHNSQSIRMKYECLLPVSIVDKNKKYWLSRAKDPMLVIKFNKKQSKVSAHFANNFCFANCSATMMFNICSSDPNFDDWPISSIILRKFTFERIYSVINGKGIEYWKRKSDFHFANK